MASRLVQDAAGRRLVVVTTPIPAVPVGRVFRVRGNEIGSGLDGTFGFTGTRTGFRNPVTEPRRRNSDPVPVDASV